MAKSIAEWMQEGEDLYKQAMLEYGQLESQLTELESRLAAKQAEVNQLAKIIGKPAAEGNRRLTAELVSDNGSVPNSPATIARALAGKHIGR